MSKNPYEVLGLPEDATQAEIEEQYQVLRDKYRLDMHCEGVTGRDAARKLTEVENAFSELSARFTHEAPTRESDRGYTSYAPSDDASDAEYAEIERLIKAGKIGEADSRLNNITTRGARWNHCQAAIYYHQGDLENAKRQLELACSMDPMNTAYKSSLEKINRKIESRTAGRSYSDPGDAPRGHRRSTGYSRSYTDPGDARATEDSCCRACQTMICVNCLCDCCCRG